MKYAKFFCALILILALLPLQVHGVEMDTKNSKTIICDDGSFIIVTLCEQVSRAGNEKNASKTYTYYNALDSELWSATLYSTFTFDGTEYWTTASSISVDIQNTSWYVISQSASHSGCGATGDVTMGQKVLGVTVNKESVTITLSCSPYGVIS